MAPHAILFISASVLWYCRRGVTVICDAFSGKNGSFDPRWLRMLFCSSPGEFWGIADVVSVPHVQVKLKMDVEEIDNGFGDTIGNNDVPATVRFN
jgi:hypothetical protein